MPSNSESMYSGAKMATLTLVCAVACREVSKTIRRMRTILVMLGCLCNKNTMILGRAAACFWVVCALLAKKFEG